MAQRYQIRDGIVIQRYTLPNGDVIATLMSEQGKWQALAKKGKRLGGNVGKLSLFHDVTAQYYRKGQDDLAILTQVQLNGALPRLSEPNIYPYAHVLAELVNKLTVDVHVGEDFYQYFVSALRGLNQGENAAELSVVFIWKLLQAAGLNPRVSRCVICGTKDTSARFDIALGGLSCESCNRGIPLSNEVLEGIQRIHTQTVRQVLSEPLADVEGHLRLIHRYLAYHVSELKSMESLNSFKVAQGD